MTDAASGMHTGHRASVLVVALLVTVSSAACGGTRKAGDQSLAENAIVRLSDLPGEWTDETGEGTFRCASFDTPGLVVTGRAQSAFNLYAVGSVSSFAAVYKDAAGDAFERFVDRATNCSKRHVQRLLEKPAELLKGISAEDLSPKERALLELSSLADMRVREIRLPPVGDDSRAYGFAVGRSLGPFGLELSPVQVAFIRKGRTVAFLFFSSIGGLTDDFVVELSEKVASRI